MKMRAVLFDDDTMEPLTVLNIPMWAHDRLREGERIHVPVPERSFALGFDRSAPVPECVPIRTVTVWFERFIRNGEKHWMLMTRDSENALKLKAVFLPGQNAEVQRRERDAFAEGLLAALKRV
jgi:hypothetical protein